MSVDKITVPRHLIVFLRLIKPVNLQLNKTMTQVITPNFASESETSFRDNPLFSLKNFINNLDRTVGDGLGGIANDTTASEFEIARAVNNFKFELYEVLHAFDYLRSLRLEGEAAKGGALLIAIYRHTLGELQRWLNALVEILSDPLAAIKNRGLPSAGQIEITFELNLTRCPQQDEFEDWLEFQCGNQPAHRSVPVKQEKKSSFCLSTMIIGFWLGSELSEHFFGE